MKWRLLPVDDYFVFARSHHSAAKKLARMLDVDPGAVPEFDLCPVLSAYRHAIELHLKVIVLGDGGHFLAPRPDELSVNKTKSLSWLGQFVIQIVKKLKWEEEFQTEGIQNIAEFKAVIEEANEIIEVYDSFRCPVDPTPPETLKSTVLELVRRLDALLDLLAETADALAAEWDLRSDPFSRYDGNRFKPTIQ